MGKAWAGSIVDMLGSELGSMGLRREVGKTREKKEDLERPVCQARP